jgi:hypothetical protein
MRKVFQDERNLNHFRENWLVLNPCVIRQTCGCVVLQHRTIGRMWLSGDIVAVAPQQDCSAASPLEFDSAEHHAPARQSNPLTAKGNHVRRTESVC